MCGICGEITFSGRDVSKDDIIAMANTLIHRGPDDSGLYCNGNIGLGHRRLSIIDLSSQGRQPIWSNDKTLCIIFNGEVYNYPEIKSELLQKGYFFSGSTDTEVIVNAIHCWGIEKALSHFIGMFAFALWNERNKTLYLCRDRAGIKPLYYYHTERGLLFASEIKAFLAHPDFRKELNITALSQYFITGYFLGNSTVFKDAFKLLPGHCLAINANKGVSLHKYWSLDSIAADFFKGSFVDAVDKLDKILESAFKYRLVSDVPVGLFLSGGVDSSLVSAILKNRANADIVNITIGFKEEKYNEVEKATKVATRLGVKHIVHYIGAKEAQESIFDFCKIYDEPFADTSGIPTSILARLARKHVKVALSADGGDEQFCGYDSYADYTRQYGALKNVPWLLRCCVSQVLGRVVPYRILLSRLCASEAEGSLRGQHIARFEKMLELMKVSSFGELLLVMNEKGWSRAGVVDFLGTGKQEDIFRETAFTRHFPHKTSDEMINSMMHMDYEAFLRDDVLVKADRASMAASLECRDPFLDHRIAEFAYSLPVHYLYANGENKHILRHMLRKWVGEDIAASPKRGFVIPLYSWLRGIWKPVVLDHLSPSRVKVIGFLDPAKVSKEVETFYKYNGCRAEKIWMMLNFQMWAEKWYKSGYGTG